MMDGRQKTMTNKRSAIQLDMERGIYQVFIFPEVQARELYVQQIYSVMDNIRIRYNMYI